MHRSGLFWKVLLPGLGIVAATALVATSVSLSTEAKFVLLGLLMLAVLLHAVWITRRVTNVATVLSSAIRQLGTDQVDQSWSDSLPIEAAPLAKAAADLEQRLQGRIDDLHRGKADFANATSLLETVLSTMVEGVVVLDREQHVLFTNPASLPLLDIQSDEVAGRPLWEVARLSSVRRAVETVLNTASSSGETEPQVIEFEIPRTRLFVAATITALPREPMPGVMLVLHDVTDIRRLESLRRDFVSNVSHELKTPLTSIQAYADTLLEDDTVDPRQSRQFLEKIVEQAERLGTLIVDIIRLGKIESTPDVFDVRPVAVLPVISACLEAHETIAITKGITLRVEDISTDRSVLADSDEVRTIFDNLVDNALHYTPRDGSVSIRVLEPTDNERLLGIAVSDTGIGMAKDQQKRVFERFYRVDRARDRQQGGTGLGLSIVKHLCQVFGGRIDVDSELGVGSTFTAWLPVCPHDIDSQNAFEAAASASC